MRSKAFFSVLFGTLLLAGCATTGRNQQTDVDALNARVSALQGQLAEKDQQIAALQNQMSDQRMAKDAAETAMKSAEAQRAMLQAQLDSAQSRKSSSTSDLK